MGVFSVEKGMSFLWTPEVYMQHRKILKNLWESVEIGAGKFFSLVNFSNLYIRKLWIDSD